MTYSQLNKAAFRRAGLGAFFKPKDLRQLGVTFYELQKGVESGKVEKAGSGLYRLLSIEPNEFETIAMVASAIPSGIICLLSALRIHEIGTQNPFEVWVAIDRRTRKPTRIRIPTQVRFFSFSGAMLSYGVQTKEMLGVPVKITSPARTVADCFRYRNKVGLDVAIEALREVVRHKSATMDEIVRAAEICRVGKVIQPYLEMLIV